MTMEVYECKNSSCTLGTPGNPGRFSGGATKEQITNLTGDPEPENFGDGVCPNCGEKGSAVKSVPPPQKGSDPYQELHDKIGQDMARDYAKLMARVADPDDDMDAEAAKEEYRALAGDAQSNLNRRIERVEAGDKS